jgi:hypothetical protein
MAASDNDEDFVDIKLTLPEIPFDPPATDGQKVVIKAVFMDAYDPSDLTMGQASLILDCASYMNGVIDFMKIYNPSLQLSSKTEMLFRSIGVELILSDEERRKIVYEWNCSDYNLSRIINLPRTTHNPSFFKRFFWRFLGDRRSKRNNCNSLGNDSCLLHKVASAALGRKVRRVPSICI